MASDWTVLTDLKECEQAWNALIKPESFFDEWQYRVCFFDPKFHELHFLVRKEKGTKNPKPLALIPLWKDKESGELQFFGGEFMEFNRMIAPPPADLNASLKSLLEIERVIPPSPESIEAALKSLPKPAVLKYIPAGQDPNLNPETIPSLVKMSERYTIDLRSCEFSIEKYMATFNAKHRKNLKRDLRPFDNPRFATIINRLEDLDRLIELNKARFADDSFFAWPWFEKGFHAFLKKAKANNHLRMLTVNMDGKPEAVQAGMFYKGRYSVLLGGNNLKVPNIGKWMIVKTIEDAITLKADILDFLCTEAGWKALWNMLEEPVYGYTNVPHGLELH